MLAGKNGGDYRERRSQMKDAIDCKSPCQLIEKPVDKLDDSFPGKWQPCGKSSESSLHDSRGKRRSHVVALNVNLKFTS